MEIKQKDIVLLPYPFTDLKGKKIRPALVVSNDSVNSKSKDCIMLPLTSVIKDEPYSIAINQEDLSSGQLIKSSRIKIDKIFTVEKRLIVMKIGILSHNTFEKVKEELFNIF
ncbi:type II toxin-antitoxin system PemK/MazF family toxin [Candidatus Woesearchaeota archaeon]|nr:type II toxin-antitoxin system PemK/MazF family toxin [Candidatus Woesearchaeota archaeon]